MYKAHPLSSINENPSLLKYFDERDIEVIPNKIPIELVLWEYKNIDVGGFSSSIVSLIDPKRVKFIFGQHLGYSELLFDKDHSIPTYNVLVSGNIAVHLLASHYNLENRINEKLSIINNYEEVNNNLRREIDELNTQIMVLNTETRIPRFSYRVLRKIKHFFTRKDHK